MSSYTHFIWVLSRKSLLVFPLCTIKQLRIQHNFIFTEVSHHILNHDQRLFYQRARKSHLKLHR